LLAETYSKNFKIRSINPVSDDLSEYLKWMQDEKLNKFILSVNKEVTLESLSSYVTDKNEKSDCLLLGIFEISTRKHIGNIKLEPIVKNSTATLGILIGDQDFRGKGFGLEIIKQVCDFAKINLSLKKIELGVDIRNTAAVKLYFKCGFQLINNPVDSEYLRKMEILL